MSHRLSPEDWDTFKRLLSRELAVEIAGMRAESLLDIVRENDPLLASLLDDQVKSMENIIAYLAGTSTALSRREALVRAPKEAAS